MASDREMIKEFLRGVIGGAHEQQIGRSNRRSINEVDVPDLMTDDFEKVLSDLGDVFVRKAITQFRAAPSDFEGHSSHEEWRQQAGEAAQEMEADLIHAIESVFEQYMDRLHQGEFGGY